MFFNNSRFLSVVTLPGIGLAFGILIYVSSAACASAEEGAERQAAQALDSVRSDPLALHEFLKRMPKGADLHNHLDGAVYAETFIRVGGEDGLCVDPVAKGFTKSQPIKSGAEPEPACEAGDVPAAAVPKNQRLYDELIDSFSMRGFVPSEGETGHDHFFGTFAKFGGTDHRHIGDFLHDVTARAAAQNEQYLELMATPTWNRLNTIAKDVTWREDLKNLRDEFLAKGLTEDIPAARAFWDQAEAVRRERGQCGTPNEAPACKVEARYVYEIFRNTPKELVFAQLVFGFALAEADPRIVAINFVGVEDGVTALEDYAEHMRMVGYMRELYPDVKVALHAGELAPGLVPPEGLCCHIRQAVEIAKADRIGHGVDVMYEDRPYELLKAMAKKGVMVEIALTSNDLILGVQGKAHPFSLYRKHGVPVAIATDDEGIARIDLTHEYQRAVEAYGLSYADLKQLVRNSLEYSFLPGASLFEDRGVYARVAPACGKDGLGSNKPSAECAAFIDKSEKAKQQWELERRFQAFEAAL